MVLKRIGVLSAGKVSGILYAGMGLIIGLIFSLVAVVGSAIGSMSDSGGAEGALLGMLFGLGAVIFMPIFYGLIGFLTGIVGAFLYNLVASVAGGIELELE